MPTAVMMEKNYEKLLEQCEAQELEVRTAVMFAAARCVLSEDMFVSGSEKSASDQLMLPAAAEQLHVQTNSTGISQWIDSKSWRRVYSASANEPILYFLKDKRQIAVMFSAGTVAS